MDVEGETARATEAMAGIQVTCWLLGPVFRLGIWRQDCARTSTFCTWCATAKWWTTSRSCSLRMASRLRERSWCRPSGSWSHRPRIVVLASCQSAGSGGVGLAALGPRLAEAGVPAVIAMQGNVLMTTAAEFMQSFFKELLVDGQIDRAVAVARGNVRRSPDDWMPVLVFAAARWVHLVRAGVWRRGQGRIR